MKTAQIKELQKREKLNEPQSKQLAGVCKCSLTYSVKPTFSFSF